jgi:molybdopterin synthase catalytic subunit
MMPASPPHVALSATTIDAAQVAGLVAGTGAGGLVLFIGTVRDENRGRAVIRLVYEAYAPMAIRVIERVAAEARDRFAVLDVAVHHRTGELALGDVAVVVAVAAVHRAEAFVACKYVIDELKARAPIWKKEIYRDGESWLSHGP